jgi:hypothetical protein
MLRRNHSLFVARLICICVPILSLHRLSKPPNPDIPKILGIFLGISVFHHLSGDVACHVWVYVHGRRVAYSDLTLPTEIDSSVR